MTTIKITTALAAAGLISCLALPGPQASAQPGGMSGQCFYVNQINGLRPDGPRTVYACVGANTIYRFDLKSDCPDLTSAPEGLVVEPTPSGSICGAMDVDISVPSHGTTSRCLVGDIVKLSPEEAASLSSKARP